MEAASESSLTCLALASLTLACSGSTQIGESHGNDGGSAGAGGFGGVSGSGSTGNTADGTNTANSGGASTTTDPGNTGNGASTTVGGSDATGASGGADPGAGGSGGDQDPCQGKQCGDGVCSADGESCAGGASCCSGLVCCSGVPIPEGEEYCSAGDCPDSDVNLKTGFGAVDPDAILERLTALPISTWSYKTEAPVKHIGPMAQDFMAAFGVGGSDRAIAKVDADGVAFAAIQALHARLEALEARNAKLERALAEASARACTRE